MNLVCVCVRAHGMSVTSKGMESERMCMQINMIRYADYNQPIDCGLVCMAMFWLRIDLNVSLSMVIISSFTFVIANNNRTPCVSINFRCFSALRKCFHFDRCQLFAKLSIVSSWIECGNTWWSFLIHVYGIFIQFTLCFWLLAVSVLFLSDWAVYIWPDFWGETQKWPLQM